MNIAVIIERFGGIRPMADKLGHRNHTTVQGWSDRDSIPGDRMQEVLDCAQSRSISLTAAELIAANSAPQQAAA